MNVEHVYNLIHFFLAYASQADDRRARELGPIHILKYLYLADVAYAARKKGRSYTGIQWEFYHFGPWDPGAHDSIQESVRRIGAEIRVFSWGEAKKESYRYSLLHDLTNDEFERIERELPVSISGPVGKLIREYGSDTNRLLHHVYRTEPMLHASPRELLDLSVVPQEVRRAKPAEKPKLTAKQTQKRKALNAERKARFQGIMKRKIEERRQRLSAFV